MESARIRTTPLFVGPELCCWLVGNLGIFENIEDVGEVLSQNECLQGEQNNQRNGNFHSLNDYIYFVQAYTNIVQKCVYSTENYCFRLCHHLFP